MIWPWKTQVWFHPININCHICTSLDVATVRAGRSGLFLGKAVLKCVHFL